VVGLLLQVALLKSAQLEAENLHMKQQLGSSSRSAAPQGFTRFVRGPQHPLTNSSPHTPSRPSLVAADISPPGELSPPAPLLTIPLMMLFNHLYYPIPPAQLFLLHVTLPGACRIFTL
jgi:hypothetical protein